VADRVPQGRDPGAATIGPLGLEGDEQADRAEHGGVEMAVLAYAAAHYPQWRTDLGLPEIGPGGFAENLTVEHYDETTHCVGDVVAAGGVRLQISQPRGPCSAISMRWDREDLLRIVTQRRRAGWYLRVLEPGTLSRGDRYEVIERPHPGWTVDRVFALRHEPADDPDGIAWLARCPELSPDWREKFARHETRLARG
jgi:MOSC domain-containing protein YiiM